MMGRSHLITGVCALEHAWAVQTLIGRTGLMEFQAAQTAAAVLQSYTGIMELSVGSLTAAPVYVAAYFLGTLLPDIDNPKSLLGRIFHFPVKHRRWIHAMLGRIFHFPVKHRRWIHAIYLYLLLAIAGWYFPVCSWIFFGVIIHLFWDSFSAAGNCWFYKLFSDYREYPNGAFVKKGHKLKLYHAGEWSEYLLLFVIVLVTVASFIFITKGQ